MPVTPAGVGFPGTNTGGGARCAGLPPANGLASLRLVRKGFGLGYTETKSVNILNQNAYIGSYMRDKIVSLVEKMMSRIKVAAEKSDVPQIAYLSGFGKELGDLDSQLESISRRLIEIEEALDAGKTQHQKSLRKLFCQVTGGCIRQNLLTLTRHVQMGRIRVGDHLEIELPSGERFSTDVAAEGYKLRERGKIAQFYRESNVKEGDYVVLEEIDPGKWKLRKARPAEPQDWSS